MAQGGQQHLKLFRIPRSGRREDAETLQCYVDPRKKWYGFI